MNCCFCNNILFWDWLVIFIKRDEEEYILCILENMFGREFGVLLDVWVVFGIGKIFLLFFFLMLLVIIILLLWFVFFDFFFWVFLLFLLVEEFFDCGGVFNFDSLFFFDWLYFGVGEVFLVFFEIIFRSWMVWELVFGVMFVFVIVFILSLFFIFDLLFFESSLFFVMLFWLGVFDFDCCVNFLFFCYFVFWFWN